MTEQQPETGPCSWPADYGACEQPDGYAALTDAQRAGYEQQAAEYLWNWTGRVFGLCTITVRPCRSDCDRASTYFGRGPTPGVGAAPWNPVLVGGRWLNVSCGLCGGGECSCRWVSSLRLPGPIDSIGAVIIDGDTLPADAYRVYNRSTLIRTDGRGWPTCQDLSAPDDADGSWTVTYDRGTPVPAGGQAAAARLAVEFWKAACGDKTCGLPQRVQTVTRQGVTVAMLDSFDDVDRGHTGIWVIDSWVSSVVNRPTRSRVYSPDGRHRVRRTTWTSAGAP